MAHSTFRIRTRIDATDAKTNVVVARHSDHRGDSPAARRSRTCSGSSCCYGSVAVLGMPIQEGGESLRNCLWTLKLQEVSGALNDAIFHLREP